THLVGRPRLSVYDGAKDLHHIIRLARTWRENLVDPFRWMLRRDGRRPPKPRRPRLGQMRDQRSNRVQTRLVVRHAIVRHTGRLRVRTRAAEGLRTDLLTNGRLHQKWPRQENGPPT